MEWRRKIFSNAVDVTAIMNEKNRWEMAGNEVVTTYDAYFDRWVMNYRPKKEDSNA